MKKKETTKNTNNKITKEIKKCSHCAKRKKTIRDEAFKKDLINRLNRIEGQIKGIKNMVKADIYCNDILIQASAVSGALKVFNKELLINHMKNCVVNDIKKGNTKVIDEVNETIRKLMK